MSRRTSRMHRVIAGVIIGLVATGNALAFDLTEFQKIAASIPDPDAHFGSAIAIDNDVLVVGAKDDDEGGSLAGAAYVYRFINDHWAQETKLIASDTEPFVLFGTSVAIDDDVIVVGARRSNEHLKDGGVVVDIGAAYVFRFDGQDWVEEARLIASDFFIFDELGAAVAVDGYRIIAGAHHENTACEGDPDPKILQNCRSGAAYVFDYDGKDWNETAKIVPSDPHTQVRFGSAIGLQGDVAVIGAWNEGNTADVCPPNCATDGHGAAYVYRFNGDEWIEEQKIVPPGGGDPFDYLGFSVSISDERIIAGDEGDNETEVSGGAAFIYRFDAKSPDPWVLQQKLVPADLVFADFFGRSVTLDGDIAVIGSDFNDIDGNFSAGAAYIFTYDGGTWSEQVKLHASDPEAWALFGQQVHLNDGRLVVGSLGSDEGEDANAGSAYYFAGVSDCNDNGTLDLIDLDQGNSPDDDNSGIPDECEGPMCGDCPTDVDGSGNTGASDLAVLLGSWGPCAPGDACECLDDNGDRVIGAADLAVLLGSWGPCL